MPLVQRPPCGLPILLLAVWSNSNYCGVSICSLVLLVIRESAVLRVSLTPARRCCSECQLIRALVSAPLAPTASTSTSKICKRTFTMTK